MTIKSTQFKTDHQVGEMPTVGNYNALNQAAQLLANTFGGAQNWMNGAGVGSQNSPTHHQLQALVTKQLTSGQSDGATHEAEAIFKLGTTDDWQDRDSTDLWTIRIDTKSKPEVEIDVEKVYDFYFDANIGLWQPLVSPLLAYPFQLTEDFNRGGGTLARRLILNVDDNYLAADTDTYKLDGIEFTVFDYFLGPGVAIADEEKKNSIDPWNDPPIEKGARGLYQYAADNLRVVVHIHRPKWLARWIKFRLRFDLDKDDISQTVDLVGWWDGDKPKAVNEITVENGLKFESDQFAFGYASRDPASTRANVLDKEADYVIMQLTCPVT